MSKTFKTQPWKVKVAKSHAGNAEPYHRHHVSKTRYVELRDANGDVVYESGEEIITYHGYSAYKHAMVFAGKPVVPENELSKLNLEATPDSHSKKVWYQRVRIERTPAQQAYADEMWLPNTTLVVMVRNQYHRPVMVQVVEKPECDIDVVPSAENNWGDDLVCWYQPPTPYNLFYAPARIDRQQRTKKRNRSLSRAETRKVKRLFNSGEDIMDEDMTNYLVRARGDWLL